MSLEQAMEVYVNPPKTITTVTVSIKEVGLQYIQSREQNCVWVNDGVLRVVTKHEPNVHDPTTEYRLFPIENVVWAHVRTDLDEN